MAGCSEYLRVQADSIWAAQHAHPFVRGIGDGTLDPERFACRLRQDDLFLIDDARQFAAAILRAPDLDSMTTFTRLLDEAPGREMELRRSYCAEYGITPEDLERTTKSPTTQGYTDFLLRTATTGNYTELLGALLACVWGYSEVAWINVDVDVEFAELATWRRNLVDVLLVDVSTTRSSPRYS